MASSPNPFYCLWQEKRIREILFDLLRKEDICAVRLANSACCNLVTRRLFLRTHLTFTAGTFTKPCRIQALSRIGHHIEHLTFHFAHTEATFLPPLIHPETGREINFLYTPHTSMASVLTRPKYGNSEFGNILTQQYPPLFHAATNVPSFILAMGHLTNMRHLTIRCPGQNPQERYRRDVVDYALISLRIAVERAPLLKLSKLSLACVHPSAFNYLRPVPGFGGLPSASRRWQQIRRLSICVESWDFYGPSPGLDHLKIIDDYIRLFAPALEKLSFAWLGRRGRCPLALSGDPLFAPPRTARKLFNEVTSSMSPLPERPPRAALVLPHLRRMHVCNASMNAAQLAALVSAHRPTVRDFDFEDVALLGGGSWEEALAPLMEESHHGRHIWSRAGGSSPRGFAGRAMASPSAATSELSFETATASTDDFEIQSPSAAVTALSRELLELGMEDLETFVGLNYNSSTILTAAEEETEVEDDKLGHVDDVASEMAPSFSTRLTKRRIRRRHRSHDDETIDFGDENDGHHGTPERRQPPALDRKPSSASSHRSHGRHRSGEAPSPPQQRSSPWRSAARTLPTPTPSPPQRENPPIRELDISAPIHDTSPPVQVMLLQPTVYNPSSSSSPPSSSSAAAAAADSPMSRHSILAAAATACYDDAGDGLSAVQRWIEQEEDAERRRLLAVDEGARSSALQKAKAAVLLRLAREFGRQRQRHCGSGIGSGAGPGPGVGGVNGTSAAAAAAAAASAGFGSAAAASMRLRGGLFGAMGIGRNNNGTAGGGGVACGSSGDDGYGWGPGGWMSGAVAGGSFMSVLPDHLVTSMERGSGTSALVPLMFSRS